MAGSVNKVILIGNLGKDPEIRRTQDGRPIANLRVATTESWRDKASGEKREKTEWHSVVIFNEGPVPGGGTVPEEGCQGLHRRPASDPQMARPGRSGQVQHGSGAAELQRYAHDAGWPQRRRRQCRHAGGRPGELLRGGNGNGDGSRRGGAKPGGAKGGYDKKIDDEIPF